MLGQSARFERFTAELMYMIAAGQKIDADRAERFSAQVDKLYADPFANRKTKRQPYTAKEIKEYVLCLLEGKEWT